MSGRDRARERARLVALSARIGRRRQWWAAQRDTASVRLDALTMEAAAVDARLAALDAGGEREPSA